VYAVGLDGAGRRRQAIEVLERSLRRHPYDRDTLSALIAFTREGPETAQLVKGLEAEAAR
jgi:hypothetical protein